MSNNKIQSMSDTSFHFLKNLRLLELHDNRIEQVMKGTFQVFMILIFQIMLNSNKIGMWFLK